MLFGKKQKEDIPLVDNPVSSESIVSLCDNLSELKNLADAIKEQASLLVKQQKGFCEYLYKQDIDGDAAEDLECNLSDVEGYLGDIIDTLSDAEKTIAPYK